MDVIQTTDSTGLVGQKRRRRAGPTKPIQIRIKPDLLARIEVAAARRGINRSAFMCGAITEKLESMGMFEPTGSGKP